MKKYLTVFHNGSNHDYHFIKRELEKEFEDEFSCLKENTKKYKSFSVQLTNKFKGLVKMEQKSQEPYLTKLQFIDSARFMTGSSNLVDNLRDGIHKIKGKYRHDNKKIETCGIKYKNCGCCLECTNL